MIWYIKIVILNTIQFENCERYETLKTCDLKGLNKLQPITLYLIVH